MDTNLKAHMAAVKTTQKVEEAMKAVIDCTNVMGSDAQVAEGMVNAILRSHPTLAQSFFRALVTSCKGIQDNAPYWLEDGRLTGSKELVKRIAEFDEAIPFI
jgi:hypothetical protein